MRTTERTPADGGIIAAKRDAHSCPDCLPTCVRCGERTTVTDVAEVKEGIVHQTCMRPGEEIA